jgi:predicted ABC-type ATPase
MKMHTRRRKKIVIIAGPNGAGKTTFAMEFLLNEADCPDFINVDLIAQGLSPFDPDKVAIQAGKIMLSLISSKVSRGESFAFETTLAGLNYVRHIARWRKLGFHVKLVFLSLPSVDMAVARVRSRVVHGGHDVPEDVVRRRFAAGLKNFRMIYRDSVDSWVFVDNAVSPY